MCCSRKFRALIGAFLVAALMFAPLINVAPTALAEGDVEAETQDVEVQEANDNELEPQADEPVTYGGEQLSDWTYTDNSDNSITLTAYNATATDIIIPGDFGDGKIVKINSFDMLKDKGMTSLNFREVNGHKVLFTSRSLTMAFYNCKTVKSMDLDGLDLRNVNSMAGAFMDCTALTEIINITADNATDGLDSVFAGCTSLRKIDLSHLNTQRYQKFSATFLNCQSLESLDFSNFNTSNGWLFSRMFEGINLHYLDLSSFTVQDSANINNMFDVAPNADGTVSELPTAIIATAPKLKALEQDGKLGNGRIPYQATITFNEDEIATQANDGNSNVKTIKADKIFYDSVAEFQEALKAFTLTKDQVLADIAEPTKAGFTFNGWFTDAAATTPLGDTLTLAGTGDNVTLYAGWTAIEPAPGPETGDVDNPGSDVSGDEIDSTEQATDEASVSTVTPVTGDNVAIVAGIALSMLILTLLTAVFARKRRQQ